MASASPAGSCKSLSQVHLDRRRRAGRGRITDRAGPEPGGYQQVGQLDGVGDIGGDGDPGELLADVLAVTDGVVRAERYEPAVGRELGDAALHELTHVQGVGVL